jgi:type IV pilus assembly protein PilM
MNLPSKLSQLNFKLPGRSDPDVVGLDIQPGFVAAVQARVNGTVIAERVAALPLAADTVRDGEVLDEAALTEALRELFATSGLGKRVRVGVANQRTVLRTFELPPVTDHGELAAAVNFMAQEQVPMPLNNAVLDFHPLGVVDTPEGPRQRVVLVAAQRDMIERLLSAVRNAGLTPAGVDLSAFALIRSLYRHDPDREGRVLYLNVDGLTNLAIAEGKVCRFTRVVGGGLEGMAVELAERRGVALADAREMLAAVDLRGPAPAEPDQGRQPAPEPAGEPAPADEPTSPQAASGGSTDADAGSELDPTFASAGEHESMPDAGAPGIEDGVAYDYAYESGQTHSSEQTGDAVTSVSDADVWAVLENGIRDISGEVRNSLDFHRSQDGGGEVSHIVLSGAAEEIPGFAEALQMALGVEVSGQTVAVAGDAAADHVSKHRLAVATGLATAEAPE